MLRAAQHDIFDGINFVNNPLGPGLIVLIPCRHWLTQIRIPA